MKIEAMRQYLRYYAREYGEIVGSYTGNHMAAVNARVDRINAHLLLSIRYDDGFYYVRIIVSGSYKDCASREYKCKFFSLKKFEQALQWAIEDTYKYVEEK